MKHHYILFSQTTYTTITIDLFFKTQWRLKKERGNFMPKYLVLVVVSCWCWWRLCEGEPQLQRANRQSLIGEAIFTDWTIKGASVPPLRVEGNLGTHTHMLPHSLSHTHTLIHTHSLTHIVGRSVSQSFWSFPFTETDLMALWIALYLSLFLVSAQQKLWMLSVECTLYVQVTKLLWWCPTRGVLEVRLVWLNLSQCSCSIVWAS